MYAIAGLTGHTGSAAAKLLLERKQRVRGIVRDERKAAAWKARGVELITASLDDAAALTRALSGVDGAYLLLPPDYSAPDLLAVHHRQADTMARAVQESGVPHVVFLSSMGGQHAAGTGPIGALHYAENALGRAARNLTVLRAGYFLENWAPMLEGARVQGALATFLTPGRPLTMVATTDIGRAAAEALLDPPRGTRIIELSGPADWTPEDVARAVAELLGRPVRLQALPLDAAVPAFSAAGFSRNSAELLREMLDGLNRGTIAFEGGSAVRRRGTLGLKEALGPLLAGAGATG